MSDAARKPSRSPAPSESSPETSDLERRLDFLQLSPEDAERLRRLAPVFRAYAPTFVEAFYKHLLKFDETAQFLHDPQRVERLKRLQQEHLESMLGARWDEEYVEARHRVGQAHADAGIQPHLFLAAYNQYIQHCFRHFGTDGGEAVDEFLDGVLPLIKAIILDIGLTLDAYFRQLTRDMRTALDMFWKANNELRQFAQFASHDLKTPLATVANLCDEALDEFEEQMPEGARELLRKAQRRIYRMSTTIDELLAVAVSTRSESRVDKVVALDVVHEALDRVRPLMEEKRVELLVPESLPTVRGDRVRLREALYNVLSNAVKFIDKVPGRIEITARTDGGLCVITIADNGPGIPANELQRIFVPFRRLASHRDKPGSGLGLYFTKNLIEQQGGRVWVESELGRGSRFHVELATLDTS